MHRVSSNCPQHGTARQSYSRTRRPIFPTTRNAISANTHPAHGRLPRRAPPQRRRTLSPASSPVRSHLLCRPLSPRRLWPFFSDFALVSQPYSTLQCQVPVSCYSPRCQVRRWSAGSRLRRDTGPSADCAYGDGRWERSGGGPDGRVTRPCGGVTGTCGTPPWVGWWSGGLPDALRVGPFLLPLCGMGEWLVPVLAVMCFRLPVLRGLSRQVERRGAAPSVCGFLGIVVASAASLLSWSASSWR